MILFPLNINAQNNTKSIIEKAEIIKVYSFKANFYDFDNIYLESYGNYPRNYQNLPKIVNGHFQVHQVHEILTLNDEQKTKLYQVLEDSLACMPKIPIKEGEKVEDEDGGLFCGFQPRHAIVFYKNNKVFSCVVVCVSCLNIQLTFGTSGKWCHNKILLLKSFFQMIGSTKGFETSHDRIRLETIVAD